MNTNRHSTSAQVQSAIRLEHVDYRYSNDKGYVLHDVSLEIGQSSLVALLGPNGSGKTTLMRIVTGVVKTERGSMHLLGKPLANYKRREIAQVLAVVPQQLVMPFAFSVWEIVAMGRTPHVKGLAPLKASDQAAIRQALVATDTLHLQERLFTELSGGERQRVVIALALAQDPQILVLDEPTTHLDLEHQIEILELLKRLNRERGLTVLAATHDLNMAALYFDRLILLKAGKVVADGTPNEVLNAQTVDEVFRARVEIMQYAESGRPYIVVKPDQSSARLKQDDSSRLY